jgi:hypothetical protein
MFRDFGAADVDVVAHGLHLLQARFEDADLAAHLTLAVALKREEGSMDILQEKSKTDPLRISLYQINKII